MVSVLDTGVSIQLKVGFVLAIKGEPATHALVPLKLIGYKTNSDESNLLFYTSVVFDFIWNLL